MTIKSKYNIGDKCFTLFDNNVYEVIIQNIYAYAFHDRLEIEYAIRFPSGGTAKVSEQKLFKTKSALLKAL